MLDLLTETGMLDCKPVETPMEMNHKLGILPDQAPTDKGRYQRLVGRLIYLSHKARYIICGERSEPVHACTE